VKGVAVVTINRSIDVPATGAEAAAAWVGFIDSVLVGRRRLECDELTCVDPTASEIVGFEDLGEGRTRVNLAIPLTDDEPPGTAELLGHKASHDLVQFWDYIDSGEYRRDHPADAVGRAAVKEDVRRGRLTPAESRPDVESLSVRRSGRT
jgi:hypothetical protein